MFANVLLVDEINRAMPKTQSALLEAMAEQQVTVDGETRPLPDPFLVLATQNPIEYEGTFPLPEAQLDRFLLRTTLGYPDSDDERRIVEEQVGGHLRCRGSCRGSTSATSRCSAQLCRTCSSTTRSRAGSSSSSARPGDSRWSPSAAPSAARSRSTAPPARWAVLNGRRYVTPEDVERLIEPVLMHRLLFRPSFVAEIRDRGWTAAVADVQARCLELAPKPGFDIDLDVPASAA